MKISKDQLRDTFTMQIPVCMDNSPRCEQVAAECVEFEGFDKYQFVMHHTWLREENKFHPTDWTVAELSTGSVVVLGKTGESKTDVYDRALLMLVKHGDELKKVISKAVSTLRRNGFEYPINTII